MVVENPLPPLGEWLPPALQHWLWAIVVLLVATGVLTFVVGWTRYGLNAALEWTVRQFLEAFVEPAKISPRRVAALAWLAVKESLRNRVLVALAVFGLVLMFAGWFLAGGSNEATLFLRSIFFWTPFLVILVTLLLGCFSLPNDIRQKTIFTLVTKPIRASEIVLGRVLGFVIVGTAMMAVMCLLGYLFVVRMVDHRHQVVAEEVTPVDLPPPDGKFTAETIIERGRLTRFGGAATPQPGADAPAGAPLNANAAAAAEPGEAAAAPSGAGHFHRYWLAANGEGRTDDEAGHWHVVTADVTPRIHFARPEPGDARRVQLHFTEPMDPVAAVNPQLYELSGGLTVAEVRISDDNRRVTLTASDKVAVDTTTVRVAGPLASRFGRSLEAAGPIVIASADPPRDVSRYVVHGPEETFRARAPVYGKLRFRDRYGKPVAHGINVGSIWTYRSYIQGATEAAAIWEFENVSPEQYGDILPLEMIVRVFRTHKGRIERTIRGTIVLRNPANPRIASVPRQFLAKDGQIDRQHFARSVQGIDAQDRRVELDLYRDLVHDGRIEVVLQCQESGQLFGAAQPDAYLLAREGSFGGNYLRACVAMWFPMVLVVGLGVMASTFLSGPVAMLATGFTLVAGYFVSFIAKVAAGALPGGGPIEASVRLIRQMNLVQPLEKGSTTDLIQYADKGLQRVWRAVANMVPDFGGFLRDDYLANGFLIPGDHLAILAMKTLGYLLPVLFIGYFVLKNREVAK